jgi:hypothetical protein
MVGRFWWTWGESDSHTPDANRVHYHYATGPRNRRILLFFELQVKAIWERLYL